MGFLDNTSITEILFDKGRELWQEGRTNLKLRNLH